MRLMRRLRRLVRAYLCEQADEPGAVREDLDRELAGARAIAALAVAQARRAELDLREALEQEPADQALLGRLTSVLEETRDRARRQVAAFHEQRRAATEELERRGELARAEQLNAQRDQLRSLLQDTAAVSDRHALEDLETSVRAEAARLDVLEMLDGGRPDAALPRRQRDSVEDPADRARRVLNEPAEPWL